MTEYGKKITLLTEGELQTQQDDILGRRWYWIHWAIAQAGKAGTGPLSDLSFFPNILGDGMPSSGELGCSGKTSIAVLQSLS